jgi:hypothetical protein
LPEQDDTTDNQGDTDDQNSALHLAKQLRLRG